MSSASSKQIHYNIKCPVCDTTAKVHCWFTIYSIRRFEYKKCAECNIYFFYWLMIYNNKMPVVYNVSTYGAYMSDV